MSNDCMIANEISNNKNKQNVRCRFCNSLMLKDQQGVYEKSQVRMVGQNNFHAEKLLYLCTHIPVRLAFNASKEYERCK